MDEAGYRFGKTRTTRDFIIDAYPNDVFDGEVNTSTIGSNHNFEWVTYQVVITLPIRIWNWNLTHSQHYYLHVGKSRRQGAVEWHFKPDTQAMAQWSTFIIVLNQRVLVWTLHTTERSNADLHVDVREQNLVCLWNTPRIGILILWGKTKSRFDHALFYDNYL